MIVDQVRDLIHRNPYIEKNLEAYKNMLKYPLEGIKRQVDRLDEELHKADNFFISLDTCEKITIEYLPSTITWPRAAMLILTMIARNYKNLELLGLSVEEMAEHYTSKRELIDLYNKYKTATNPGAYFNGTTKEFTAKVEKIAGVPIKRNISPGDTYNYPIHFDAYRVLLGYLRLHTPAEYRRIRESLTGEDCKKFIAQKVYNGLGSSTPYKVNAEIMAPILTALTGYQAPALKKIDLLQALSASVPTFNYNAKNIKELEALFAPLLAPVKKQFKKWQFAGTITRDQLADIIGGDLTPLKTALVEAHLFRHYNIAATHNIIYLATPQDEEKIALSRQKAGYTNPDHYLPADKMLRTEAAKILRYTWIINELSKHFLKKPVPANVRHAVNEAYRSIVLNYYKEVYIYYSYSPHSGGRTSTPNLIKQGPRIDLDFFPDELPLDYIGPMEAKELRRYRSTLIAFGENELDKDNIYFTPTMLSIYYETISHAGAEAEEE